MGGAREGGGGGKTIPIKLVQRVRKCIPSLCLLPRPSLTKYPVSNSCQCIGVNSFMPIMYKFHANILGSELPHF